MTISNIEYSTIFKFLTNKIYVNLYINSIIAKFVQSINIHKIKKIYKILLFTKINFNYLVL
jgi:hypothetical protein